jgi:regulator of protease activity HflC (stomatin/prohibitin superfamily)
MTLFIVSFIVMLMIAALSVTVLRHLTRLVPEDGAAITVDRNGFIKRVLPSGRHILHPFEKVEFMLETKTKLTANQVMAVAASDGLLITVNWSGVYSLQPGLITDHISQRLRNLPNASKTIGRHVDIGLRQLLSHYTAPDLFKPVNRNRLERQLGELAADRLRGLGIVLVSLNLQAIELPAEVTEAINKAKAIEALDSAIRQLDPATREIVRGVYQLDEVLHWDSYLPTPSRLSMKRLAAATG